MIGTAREGFRNLVERVSKVTTMWARDPAMMVPQGPVPPGVSFLPTASTATTSDPAISGQAHIIMRITQRQVRGVDEYRQTYDEDADKLLTTISGVRVYGINFMCYALARNESPAETLELLSSRFGRMSVIDELNALGMSIAHVNTILDIQIPDSDFAGRKAFLDLRFNYAFNDADPTDLGDYIAEAPVTGTTLGV